MLKYRELIDQMTLEEKASLLSGENFWNTKAIPRLGIPSIMLTDGPHGLRKQGGKADHLGLNKSIPATCFPTAATLANSWDESLLAEVGEKLAEECAKEDVSVILGPGLNIKRSPLCGRNFEYFSEDPFLTGKMAAALIKGVESKGVSACPKHFAVNSQEHMRMSIDEVVDERALREIYLEGFRIAVTEGIPSTLMTAYNKVNGIYSNENTHLLKDILVDEWGYDGVVVTDWGGNNDRLAGLIAGNHLEMPSTGGVTDAEIVRAVNEGLLDEALLNQRIDSLLKLILKPKPDTKFYDADDHHLFALKCAKQSAVLLKNASNILPLNPKWTYAVIGDFAKTPRYQGAGSSLIEPTKLDNALSSLEESGLSLSGYCQGFKRYGGLSSKYSRDAIELAKQSDAVLLFLGLDEGSESEGIDRKTLSLHSEQLHLAEALAKVNANIIVILSGGAPITLPFEPLVKGILHSYLGGQGSGEALVSLLLGETSPSGKLAETYPLRDEDIPNWHYYPGQENVSEHRESLFIGYRYYDRAKIPVKYPFGYGLTYTTFEYSHLEIHDQQVTFTLKNTGNFPASEIAQLYVGHSNSQIIRCEKELKGFIKVYLEPGKSKQVSIPFDAHAFQHFDPRENKWRTEPGKYLFSLGASSTDIRLKTYQMITGDLDVEHFEATLRLQHEVYEKYKSGSVQNISQQDFEALLGRKLPSNGWNKNTPLMMNDTLWQAGYKSWVGRLLVGILELSRKLLWRMKKPILSNYIYFILNMPFRQLYRFSQGKFSEQRAIHLLNILNFGFIKGLSMKNTGGKP